MNENIDMIQDMRTILTRLFTVALLLMVSMAAGAQYVTVNIGNNGKFDNGSITEKKDAQTKSADGNTVTVTLLVKPKSGYSIDPSTIDVYETISPQTVYPNGTRANDVTLGKRLDVKCDVKTITKETECTVDVASNLGIWVQKAEFLSGAKGNRGVYTYYAFHIDGTGYLKQANGVVANDGTFRHEDPYNGNGSSIWVLSSDGYLQQEMYYLNVINGKTLCLSTTPVTTWDLVDDNGKMRLQMHSSTKILGLDSSNKPVLVESPAKKYTACTLTVTQKSWTDTPEGLSFTVQSPQLVTYLRTYYKWKIDVVIDENDKGETNLKVIDNKDSRCYCKLTYNTTTDGNKGTKWDINTTNGVIYSMQTSDITVTATYDVAPLNPIVLAAHPASQKSISIKIQKKPFAPDASKKYLLFNTQENNYRFPHAGSASENDFLPVDGKQSDLTEAINGDLSWIIEADAEGFYSFKNAKTDNYIYYDANDYTKSDIGAVKIGATTLPVDDTRYKFRLFSGGVSRTGFSGSVYYIIPYDKQFAVYNSTGVLSELYSAIYVNTSPTPKIGSLYKASDNAKWQIYSYEWEYRLWDNYTINGDQNIYTAGDHTYTVTTWFSCNIKGSRQNTDDCTLTGSKTKNGITYTWEVSGQAASYITTTDVLANGTSTLTATTTLPPGTRTGTLKVTAKITTPANKNNNKTIPLTLYNLNPSFTDITTLSQISDENGLYRLTEDNVYSSTNKPGVATFSGTLTAAAKTDGTFPVISSLTQPLFTTATGATISNIMIQGGSTTITSDSGPVGAICGTADGSTRIYNCGVLEGDVSGSGYTGGLVGFLDESARVINCFSYANITGGTEVGGIVGYNNYESKASDIRTMVMNCMFYGDITGGTTVSPVYGGKIINNLNSGGLNTFNYYAYEKAVTFKGRDEGENKKYNCTLAVEEKYLNRFEFYRLLLNSNRKLAALYLTNNAEDAEKMAKWVLETADRTISSPKPYPILKAQGQYPSIINIDAAHSPRNSSVGHNKGCQLGRLSVTIRTKSQKTDGGQSWPTATTSDVQITSLSLIRTDKDEDRFNFNYDKVQLPYYNDVGTGNYTENRVVTGWKITDITTLDDDPYTSANYDYSKKYSDNKEYFDYPNYNFANRKSSNKDKYSVSGRVFSQGAYFDVPYGVTSITIEPYWAKAAYISDPNYDAVYKSDYSTKQNVTQTGTQVTVGTTMFDGEKFGTTAQLGTAGQKVETSIANALTYIKNSLGGYGPKVYDNAVVLVGNFHQDAVPSQDTNPFTIMSVDLDNDREPDYSMIYHHKGKLRVSPIRFDFLNIPGTAQAQKPNGASLICNMAIIHPSAWFEITNTSSIYFSQLEYEDLVDNANRTEGPLILQGGVLDQFVSTNNSVVNGKTIYMHLGSNVWLKEFNMGTHSDGSNSTPHPPVSVTGGEYEGFYLTGTYNQDANVRTDNAECYISGGHFKEAAGTGQEAINGNVRWQIYNADMDNFYGGGTNGATGKNIKGNVTVDIFNSHVTTFCGGPKFGNMESGKKVTTNAEGCVFGKFFGAGYGGTAYSRKKYYDKDDDPVNWTTQQGNYITDRGKYFDGTKATGNALGDKGKYGYKGIGVATDFDYEYFVWSSGKTGGRFFVKFASFSLATCKEVESNLTNCTINENFYGGGKLGKVEGTVTSVLDGCTVKGNVFGAGYSATKDPIPVRDGGFTTPPKFNSGSGMFEPAIFSGTTDFEWTTHAFPANGNKAIEEDGTPKYVWTDQTLTNDNLGSVNGNVSLTIKGNSEIGTNGDTSTGHVYGGGDDSYVIGSGNKITVTLQGNAHVLGNVYGGGNKGLVQGSTKVNIKP